MNMIVRDKDILGAERTRSGYYDQPRLRLDDWLSIFTIIVLPLFVFAHDGTWWLLVLALLSGSFWAQNAGSTDFANSLEPYVDAD